MIELYKNHMVAITEDGEEHAVPFLSNDTAQSLRNDIDSLNSDVSTLSSQIGNLEGEVDDLQLTVSGTAFSSANPSVSIEYSRLVIFKKIAFFGIRCQIANNLQSNIPILNITLPSSSAVQSIHSSNRTNEIFDTPTASKNIRCITSVNTGTLIISGILFLS